MDDEAKRFLRRIVRAIDDLGDGSSDDKDGAISELRRELSDTRVEITRGLKDIADAIREVTSR